MQYVASLGLQSRPDRVKVRRDEASPIDEHDRQARLDDRDWAVLEIGHGPSTCEHIARLAELQRDLLGGREVEAAAEHDSSRSDERRHERFDLAFPIARAADGV